MKHKELTERVIGCAYSVYNKMGFGFLESVYEKCLMIELKIGRNCMLKRKKRLLSTMKMR